MLTETPNIRYIILFKNILSSFSLKPSVIMSIPTIIIIKPPTIVGIGTIYLLKIVPMYPPKKERKTEKIQKKKQKSCLILK